MKYLALLLLTGLFIIAALVVIIFAYYWGPKGKPRSKN
jgi:hypothetical protein